MGQGLPHRAWLWVWLAAIAIIFLFFWRVYSDSRILNPVSPPTDTIIPASNLIISPQDPSLGSAAAEVVLIELADFECPYCAEASPILEQFTRDHASTVRLVWKDFIIPSHANSLPAAQAAQCAAKQGKFWEYQRELFLNQTTLGNDLFIRLAESVGLDSASFNNCLSNQASLPLIEFNQEQIRALGLTETPTLFVNGRIFTDDITAEALNSLLP